MFFQDEMLQSAVLHRLALLGEACRGVSQESRDLHPEIPRSRGVSAATTPMISSNPKPDAAPPASAETVVRTLSRVIRASRPPA